MNTSKKLAGIRVKSAIKAGGLGYGNHNTSLTVAR